MEGGAGAAGAVVDVLPAEGEGCTALVPAFASIHRTPSPAR